MPTIPPEQIARIHLVAADLVDTNGLHATDWWDDAPKQPWRPGLRLCAAAAVGVATGRRTFTEMTGDVVHHVDRWDDDGDPEEIQVVHDAVRVLIEFLRMRDADELFEWSGAAAEDGQDWIVSRALRLCAAELLGQTVEPLAETVTV